MLHNNRIMGSYVAAYENSLDAFIPEIWAQESLMLLWQNVVFPRLVHTDFSMEVKDFGDVVNTRRPAKFTMGRKIMSDSVAQQDATATNVQVPLDQHLYQSFIIRDAEASMSMKGLVNTYLEPAMKSIAIGIDQILAGQVYSFLGTSVGRLGNALDKTSIIAAREKMTQNLCPLDGRTLLVSPNTEGSILNIADFTTADKIGDDGSTLRNGSIGRRFGFDIAMAQAIPSLSSLASGAVVIGAVNNSAGYPAGTTVLTVDGFSAAIALGSICTIAGDDTPQMVTAIQGTTTEITISPGLARAVVDNAVVTVVKAAVINQASAPTGYAAGWNKQLVVDGITVAPTIGQMASVGATSLATATKYGLVGTVEGTTGSMTTAPSTTRISLNRSLEAAIANDANLFLGPAGDYNFAFHRNAMALVSRPLALPQNGTGVRAAVAEQDGIGLRVTIGYDMYKQGHVVTVDLLCGTKVLDTNLGCVVFG